MTNACGKLLFQNLHSFWILNKYSFPLSPKLCLQNFSWRVAGQRDPTCGAVTTGLSWRAQGMCFPSEAHVAVPSCGRHTHHGQSTTPALKWGQRATKTSLPARNTEFLSRECLSTEVINALERNSVWSGRLDKFISKDSSNWVTNAGSPGRVAQWVTALSPFAKILGLISDQGHTRNNQWMHK